MMSKITRRGLQMLVFLAAAAGILGVLGSAAQAYMPQQHCEPLWRI